VSDIVISLLEELGRAAEPFIQSWEYEKYIAGKREVLCQLAKFQGNARVYALFARLDSDSRTDSGWEQTVQNAVNYAPTTLALVRSDDAEKKRLEKKYDLARV